VSLEDSHGKVTPAVRIDAPDPAFNLTAGIPKGTMILSIVIDETGRVVKIRLKQSLGNGLDMQAMEKVKNWRYKPAMKDGHGVPVEMTLTVSFEHFR
jgi:protein TonB